jgi:hypothetical protein
MSDIEGYDGGFDAGHQEYQLDALHAEQGAEHDSFTNFQEFAATHAEESDVEFSNYHNVEASDGHGGHYSETDATQFSASESSIDTVYDQEYTNAESSSEFSQIDQLRERFEADYLHSGPELGESGHGELTAR